MSEAPWPLRLSDGVCLDSSLVLPEGEPPAGGWPAVLLVHGHGEDGSKAMTLDRGRRLAGRGIVALCLTVRGQGASEGLSFHLGARELFDLLEVIDLLMAHPAVDAERVAVCGSSQGGWHAWMAACWHPRVRTVVPENIFVDYADFALPQGCLSTWFFTRTMRRRVMSAGLQDMARQWAIAGEWERLTAWLSPMSPSVHAGRIRCPVLVVHGWHDLGMPANPILATLEGLRCPWQLVIGGGGHDGQHEAEALRQRTARVDAWLDHHLLGLGPAPEPATAPVANLNITHVPRDPSYDLSRAIHQDLAGSLEAWPREEVAFNGPVLDAPVELRGAPRFVLHLLPERPWLQVHTELWDVAPDGGRTRVTRGQFVDPERPSRVVLPLA